MPIFSPLGSWSRIVAKFVRPGKWQMIRDLPRRSAATGAMAPEDRIAPVRGFAVLLLALSLNCAAAPFVVQLGTERIVLDAPPGFSDTAFLASPRLQELAESLTPASNRILLFAIPDPDLRRFMAGDRLELRRYLIAVTPRALEHERVSARQFAAFVEDSLRQFGKPANPPDVAKYLEEQPVGRPALLGELHREPTLVSVVVGAKMPLQGGFGSWRERHQYRLASTTLALLRGKAIEISAYTDFEGAGDVDWLRHATQRWYEELVRLNSR
jgi:hypothetical protein